jgi:hypothetical protein
MYDHQERLEREFAPTLTHLREVEGQIKHHQDEIDKLKEIHRRLVAIERIIHPPTPQPKKTKASANGMVSETTLNEAIVYLRQSYPDEEFYSTLLEADESWTPSHSHTSKILGALHERGQLRLVSRGRGGRKNFKVVA